MQMLLLEGDDMNQKTGICILLCLVLLLVFGIWYQKRGVENTKNNQPAVLCTDNIGIFRFFVRSSGQNGVLCFGCILFLGIFYRMEKPYIWKPGFEVRI